MGLSSTTDDSTDLKLDETSLEVSHEIKYKGVKVMPFIIGNEMFDKLGGFGIGANLLVYLTTVFNMKPITATNLLNIFSGTGNLGTLVGAFLSDTYFGRYKTLAFASICYFLGMLVLTLTALIPNLHPPSCQKGSSKCAEATSGQLTILLSGFGLLIIGAGGLRPCNIPFGADQFNPNTESGRKGINSFFSWYYFTTTFAVMVSFTVLVYVQNSVNWALGFAIPTFLMFISCLFFFVGTRMYVMITPQGSPLTSMAQVMVAAIKKRHMHLPDHPWDSLFAYISSNSINSKLPYTDQFRFLTKAAIITPGDRMNLDGSASNPWRLCSIQQVEELKCVVRIIPIWFAGAMYFVALKQIHTYVVFQAIQSDRRIGIGNVKIPPASFIIFSLLGFSICTAIYDTVMVPLLRRITNREEGITVLKKIGVGMVIAPIALILSGVVEYKRRTMALSMPFVGTAPSEGGISPMNARWLIPQLALIGVSESFAIIGQVAFFYKEFPESMRSFGGSFLSCGAAMTDYMGSSLISVINRVTRDASGRSWLDQDLNKGRLDYFYYLVAALGIINLGYFLVSAKWYKYIGTQGKDIPVAAPMDEINSKHHPV
ncbi:protein NRT1/ PTR FAMILY 2.11-like [Coffea eugenioides]|uniref:protein NRT1/ PTR FAMILY 2.11-like n=1 Tax=Coffea eugenioides TaxID=49369 RepID=UPI000F607F58|nr:protein NRT1/ PTR FAMILY 2.11-like [Coffea eugenioides]